jgi:hypothetical protein
MLIPHIYQGSGAPAAVPLLPPQNSGTAALPPRFLRARFHQYTLS